jgi:Protein of unknown function with PCYCGC motif
MKKNWLFILGGLLLVAAVAIVINATRTKSQPQAETAQAGDHGHGHGEQFDPKRVPAHFEIAPALASLGPTLPAEQFKGQTREAYRIVKEIPQTIAQLPCYCHCDRGNGHKSLYSCYEDDHAAHCGVCINEALLAYQLEKKEKLSAAQIRQRIVDQYTPK